MTTALRVTPIWLESQLCPVTITSHEEGAQLLSHSGGGTFPHRTVGMLV